MFPAPSESEEVLTTLREIHLEATTNSSKLHGNACSRVSLFLARILVNMDIKHYNDVADAYAELQKEWYQDPKSHLQPSFFTEWTSWTIATKKR